MKSKRYRRYRCHIPFVERLIGTGSDRV
jgi:hypothetical protein